MLDDAGGVHQKQSQMKYSTHNLNEPEIEFPLRIAMKLIIEYRPNGSLHDYAPMVYSVDPEVTVDAVVENRGWNRLPGFDSKDVWVDAAF